jgi:hypothetical protein
MELTPGEKAVLGQIRVLYSQAAQRDQQVKALMLQWPPTHYETYKSAFGGLLAKQLIQRTGGEVFRITDTGLTAIGVVLPKPQAQLRRPMEQRPFQPDAGQRATKMRPSLRGALSRFAAGLLRPRP